MALPLCPVMILLHLHKYRFAYVILLTMRHSDR